MTSTPQGSKNYGPIRKHLQSILPLLRQEADRGRWPRVSAENFIIDEMDIGPFIVLTYSDDNIYRITFTLGFVGENFDPDISSDWFSIDYQFEILTPDPEVADYYRAEHKECSGTAAEILDIISYKAMFVYGDDTHFGMIVKRPWPFQKYCLMLDIMIPMLIKYKASKPLVTTTDLELKSHLESFLNTSLEITESPDPTYIFTFGHFSPTLDDLFP